MAQDPAEVIERVKAGLASRSQRMRERTLLDVVGAAVQELRSTQSSGPAEAGTGTTPPDRDATTRT